MKIRGGSSFILAIFVALVLASSSVLAETIFTDSFSEQHPLNSGWSGDYFAYPGDDVNISVDITSEMFPVSSTLSGANYMVKISNNAALIRTFSTSGMENIKFKYCRAKVSTDQSAERATGIAVAWKQGGYNSPLGEWNSGQGDENWSTWTQVDYTDAAGNLECFEKTLQGADNQNQITIAFSFRGLGSVDYGIVDDVQVTASPIQTNNGGGGGGGSGSSGTTTLPSICTENWVCDEWGECENGLQTRLCTDANACGTLGNYPGGARTCVSPATTASASEQEEQQPPSGFFATITGAVIGPNGAPTALGFFLLLLLILALYFLMKMFRKSNSAQGKKGRVGKGGKRGKR